MAFWWGAMGLPFDPSHFSHSRDSPYSDTFNLYPLPVQTGCPDRAIGVLMILGSLWLCIHFKKGRMHINSAQLANPPPFVPLFFISPIPISTLLLFLLLFLTCVQLSVQVLLACVSPSAFTSVFLPPPPSSLPHFVHVLFFLSCFWNPSLASHMYFPFPPSSSKSFSVNSIPLLF